MLVSAAARLAALLDMPRPLRERGVSAHRLLRLVDEVMGEDLARFSDGRMLIWHIARHDGYRIPDYPMAGCGDVKEFLADEGARNVPDWYRAHLGMDRTAYDQMYRYELVMVRNRALWRRVFFVPTATMASPDADLVARAALPWLTFALGRATSHDDPALFQR